MYDLSFPSGEVLKVEQTHKGRTVHEYDVKGNVHNFSDYDLINHIDKGNFGGRVVRSNNFAKVYVYVD